MALTPCRECDKEVSDQAELCPNCGIKSPGWAPQSQFSANAAPVEAKPTRLKTGLFVVGGAIGLLVLLISLAGSVTPATFPPPAPRQSAVQAAPQNASAVQVEQPQELPEPPGVSNAISVDDFMVDFSNYTDKTVSVLGMPMCLSGTICYLYSDGQDYVHGVVFDPTNLSRHNRKLLLFCNVYANRCSAIITAHGIKNQILQELAPTRINWLQQPAQPAG